MKTHGKENQNIEKLQIVINEAARFITKAEIAKNRLIENDSSEYTQYSFKEVATVKRAAMDLKRELTEITNMKSY